MTSIKVYYVQYPKKITRNVKDRGGTVTQVKQIPKRKTKMQMKGGIVGYGKGFYTARVSHQNYHQGIRNVLVGTLRYDASVLILYISFYYSYIYIYIIAQLVVISSLD